MVRIGTLGRIITRGIPLGMNLPVNPPILPMLAKRVDELPAGGDWIFDPKWDGFRTLV